MVDWLWVQLIWATTHEVNFKGRFPERTLKTYRSGFLSHRGTPKSSMLVWFCLLNHPAIGDPPFMEPPMCSSLSNVFSHLVEDYGIYNGPNIGLDSQWLQIQNNIYCLWITILYYQLLYKQWFTWSTYPHCIWITIVYHDILWYWIIVLVKQYIIPPGKLT